MSDQQLTRLTSMLTEILQLDPASASLDANTRLIGHIPELDSIAIVNIILAIEEEFGIEVDDDDIDASDFESVGSLQGYITRLQPG